MELSCVGMIADQCWREIPAHAQNIEVGPYVIMPNHVHGILTQNSNAIPFKLVESDQSEPGSLPVDELPKTVGQMRFRNPGKNTISTIVGGFKSAVSKAARKEGFYFGWQGRFHDHLIRHADEYERIAAYIIDNPAKWNEDEFCCDPDASQHAR